MVEKLPTAQKPAIFVASTREDLRAFPEEVQDIMGFAIYNAQMGDRHPDAKPLTGDPAFRGAGVMEIVERHDKNAYRAVYTVKFAGAIYVLHVFQKKSKKGVATPKADIDLIKSRLKLAREHYETVFLKRTG
jgi:phage-related protein